MICIWCLKKDPEVTFIKKAHTIPKSLGGQNYYRNICDGCNEYFGSKSDHNYSIEEALKEAFNISRRRLLDSGKPKRKVGKFKSRFFDIRVRNGKKRLIIKPSFRMNVSFQEELGRSFKRGLYKLFFEEINRQNKLGSESEYELIRLYSRYNQGDLPVLYFNRSIGAFITFGTEAETPELIFDRMDYLFSNQKFAEIEFLGHVFGFPISNFDEQDFKEYLDNSIKVKKGLFNNWKYINKMTDMDILMSIMN